MSKENIDRICDRIIGNLEELANRVLKDLNERTSIAMDNAMREFGVYQKNKITEIFNNAVDKWYLSYTPSMYERTYGLYDVLSLKYNENGTVFIDDNYRSLFDPSLMHKDRHGGDLFEKVFIEGWHGGAESGEDHPEIGARMGIGIPYYRTPPHWTEWSRRARKTKSAYKIICEDINSIYGTEMFDMFKKISQKHNDIAVEMVIKNIPYIKKQIDEESR